MLNNFNKSIFLILSLIRDLSITSVPHNVYSPEVSLEKDHRLLWWLRG